MASNNQSIGEINYFGIPNSNYLEPSLSGFCGELYRVDQVEQGLSNGKKLSKLPYVVAIGEPYWTSSQMI